MTDIMNRLHFIQVGEIRKIDRVMNRPICELTQKLVWSPNLFYTYWQEKVKQKTHYKMISPTDILVYVFFYFVYIINLQRRVCVVILSARSIIRNTLVLHSFLKNVQLWVSWAVKHIIFRASPGFFIKEYCNISSETSKIYSWHENRAGQLQII